MKDKIKEIIKDAIENQMNFEEYYEASYENPLDKIMELFQSQREQDIKAFEEIIGEDERSIFTSSIIGRKKKSQNQLRAELRTKLDQYKKENI